MLVLEAILSSASERELPFSLKSVILPVIYDQAGKKIIQAVKKMRHRPALVLSLGEGKDQFKLELLTHNLDSSKTADNLGGLRQDVPIIAGGNAVLELSFAGKVASLCREQGFEASPLLSQSAGGFVCNNTAYHVMHHFDREEWPIDYGFIHVPSVEVAGLNVKNMATAILKLILAGGYN